MRELREQVERAVASQRVADVPLGAFLSGGLDSTIVAGCLARAGGERVKTFSIGYADHPAYDQVRCRFINSMLVKASRNDRALARELLSQLPLHAWNRRTFASLLRYPFAPTPR